MIPKHAQELLDEIYRLGYTPRGKEVGFIRSVKSYIERDGQITPDMDKWLNDIYVRASGGGRYQNKERI